MKPKSFIKLVGARGFEPPTTCTPCRYATRLRYAPKEEKYIRDFPNFEPADSFSGEVPSNSLLREGNCVHSFKTAVATKPNLINILIPTVCTQTSGSSLKALREPGRANGISGPTRLQQRKESRKQLPVRHTRRATINRCSVPCPWWSRTRRQRSARNQAPSRERRSIKKTARRSRPALAGRYSAHCKSG